MVVDTYSYDILLGLDFLIKISVIMDVEQWLIQVKHGSEANMEILPIIMVNMLERMSLEVEVHDVNIALENT